jgi:hypothetical protein
MIEDSTIAPEAAKTTGQKVLEIERVILRRAWGVAYAIIAAEVFLRHLLPVSSYELGLSAVVQLTFST